MHDPDALKLLLKLFGVQRVALGSDYPFPLGEAHTGELIALMKEVSAKEKTQLLSGTAREFLGLKGSVSSVDRLGESAAPSDNVKLVPKAH